MMTRKKTDRCLSFASLWIALCTLVLTACGPSAPITIGNGYVEGVVTANADTAPDLAGTFSPTSDSQQKPVAAADVTLLDPSSGHALFARTDSAGSYTFEVSDGTYTVIAEKTSPQGTRYAHFSTVVVKSDQTVTADLGLQEAAQLSGRLTRADLKDSASHAGIVILSRETGRYAVSLSDGTYVLPGLPAGTHTLQLAAHGYIRQEHITNLVSGNSNTLDAALELDSSFVADAVLKGSVKTTGGTPIANAIIHFQSVGIAGITGDDGAFLIPVEAGKYVLNVQAPGYLPSGARHIEIANGSELNIAIELSPIPGYEIKDGQIQLSFVDNDGSAVADVDVAVAGHEIAAQSDANGKLTFTLPAGCYLANWEYDTESGELSFCTVAGTLLSAQTITIDIEQTPDNDTPTGDDSDPPSCTETEEWVTVMYPEETSELTQHAAIFGDGSQTTNVTLPEGQPVKYPNGMTVTDIPTIAPSAYWNVVDYVKPVSFTGDFEVTGKLKSEGAANTDMANVVIMLTRNEDPLTPPITAHIKDPWYYESGECNVAIFDNLTGTKHTGKTGKNSLPFASQATVTVSRTSGQVHVLLESLDLSGAPNGITCGASATNTLDLTHLHLRFSRATYPGGTMPSLTLENVQARHKLTSCK